MGLKSFFSRFTAKADVGQEVTDQSISPLSSAEKAQLIKQREVVEQYLADDESRVKYQTSVGKLGTLRALLEQDVFQASQVYELQCMGVIVGDVFVQELGMEWIEVNDEYGVTPAVRLANTCIILYPLTMISKRVEQGERVDVFDLFNGMAAQIEKLKGKVE